MDIAAPAFVDARQHNAKLTAGERCGTPAGIERAGETNGACEATEPPLGQVKRHSFAARPRRLPAGDHNRAAGENDTKRLGRHARQIGSDFYAIGVLDDVYRWTVLRLARCIGPFEECDEPAQDLGITRIVLSPFYEYSSHSAALYRFRRCRGSHWFNS